MKNITIQNDSEFHNSASPKFLTSKNHSLSPSVFEIDNFPQHIFINSQEGLLSKPSNNRALTNKTTILGQGSQDDARSPK